MIKDFHAYLRKLGVENNRTNEWFHINGPDSQRRFYEFRSNRGMIQSNHMSGSLLFAKGAGACCCTDGEIFSVWKWKRVFVECKAKIWKDSFCV